MEGLLGVVPFLVELGAVDCRRFRGHEEKFRNIYEAPIQKDRLLRSEVRYDASQMDRSEFGTLRLLAKGPRKQYVVLEADGIFSALPCARHDASFSLQGYRKEHVAYEIGRSVAAERTGIVGGDGTFEMIVRGEVAEYVLLFHRVTAGIFLAVHVKIAEKMHRGGGGIFIRQSEHLLKVENFFFRGEKKLHKGPFPFLRYGAGAGEGGVEQGLQCLARDGAGHEKNSFRIRIL